MGKKDDHCIPMEKIIRRIYQHKKKVYQQSEDSFKIKGILEKLWSSSDGWNNVNFIWKWIQYQLSKKWFSCKAHYDQFTIWEVQK